MNILQEILNYLKSETTQHGWILQRFFQRLKTEMTHPCKEEFNKNLGKNK